MRRVMFKQIKQPTIMACPRDNLTLTQMLYNHQMNALRLHGKEFEQAIANPFIQRYSLDLVNDIIMKFQLQPWKNRYYHCNGL